MCLGFLDKTDANRKLRWFLHEVLYAETWVKHPYNKVIVGYDIIDQLEYAGFWWQAERLKNHLHRWMRSTTCKDPQILDTLSIGEREEVSLPC